MNELRTIRKRIDQIDKKIAQLLRERYSEVAKIKQFKKKNNLPSTDTDREKEIFAKLETEYEKEIFKRIIQQSRKIQDSSLN